MFTQRQRKILAILKKHQYSVTSDEIARLVGVSSRTIRTEIKTSCLLCGKTLPKSTSPLAKDTALIY